MLPCVVNYGELIGIDTVIPDNLAFGELRNGHNVPCLFGDGAILGAVPCGAHAAAKIGIKIRAGFVADIMQHCNPLMTGRTHRNDVAQAQPSSAALLQIPGVRQLFPSCALTQRRPAPKGHHHDIAVFGNGGIRRDNQFQLSRFHQGIQFRQNLDGIALDSRMALGKKESVNCILGHDVLLVHSKVITLYRSLHPKIRRTLSSSRDSAMVPSFTESSTAS